MRLARESDLPAIVEIYNASIPSRMATADTDPVSVESKREWFKRHTPGELPLMVHEADGQIVAWVGFQPFYGRPAYKYTAELSIYVSPEHRNKGLGRRLLQEAIALAPELGIKTLLGYVFSHNAPSIALLESFGFEHWGKLPRVAEMDGREYDLSILGLRISS